MKMRQRFSLFFYLSFLFMRECVCIERCPAVEEGRPYTINCTGSTLGKYRRIFWSIGEDDVSSCSYMDELCTSMKEGFSSSQDLNGLKFFNTLIIDKVTPSERDMALSCKVLDVSKAIALDSEEVDVIRTCTMSVYFIPQDVRCNARKVENGVQVYVTCKASKVYPGIKCKVFDVSSNSGFEVISKPDYSRTPVENEGIEYFEASCTTLVTPRQNGLGKWKIEIYPGWDDMLVTSAIQKKTTTVAGIALYSLAQLLLPGDTETCDGKARCRGIFLPSSPDIKWYIDGQEIYGLSSKDEGNERKTFESILDLTFLSYTFQDKNKTVKCEVSYANKNEGTYFVTKPLFWPPFHPPKFRYSGKSYLSNTLELSHDTNVTLLCEVKGDNSKVDLISVKCFTQDKKTIWLQETSRNHLVTFNVTGNQAQTYHQCVCSAVGIKGCSLATKLDIVLVNSSNENTAPGNITASCVHESSAKYYIIGGVCFFVTLVFAIAIFICLRKKCDCFYHYYHSPIFSRSLDHYENVHGNLSGRNSVANDPRSPDQPNDLSNDENEGHFPTPDSSISNVVIEQGTPLLELPQLPVSPPPVLPSNPGDSSSFDHYSRSDSDNSRGGSMKFNDYTIPPTNPTSISESNKSSDYRHSHLSLVPPVHRSNSGDTSSFAYHDSRSDSDNSQVTFFLDTDSYLPV